MNKAMWKFADHTEASAIVPKFGTSNLQATVDHVLNCSNANNFQLNSLTAVGTRNSILISAEKQR